MTDQNKLFTHNSGRGPQKISGEPAEFLYRQAFKNGFHVFRVNILALFGDDHVFLAPEELQMAVAVDAPKVTGDQPTVSNRFRRHFRIVKIVRHYGLAADEYFADSVRI